MANVTTIYPQIAFGENSPQSIYAASTTKRHPLGTRGIIGNRVFYYASNSGSAITRSTLCRHAAATANHVNVAPSAAHVAGVSSVSLTLGATSAAANLYEDGWLFVSDSSSDAANGVERRIMSHASASSSGTLTVRLFEGIEEALTTADEITLRTNEYSGIVTTPGNAIVQVAGVPAFDVPAGSTDVQYFWLQTWGPCSVTGDGSTFADGLAVTYVSSGTADAGQITAVVSSSDFLVTREVVGTVYDVGSAASDLDARFIRIKINP